MESIIEIPHKEYDYRHNLIFFFSKNVQKKVFVVGGGGQFINFWVNTISLKIYMHRQ